MFFLLAAVLLDGSSEVYGAFLISSFAELNILLPESRRKSTHRLLPGRADLKNTNFSYLSCVPV